jgi:hypothetical protein
VPPRPGDEPPSPVPMSARVFVSGHSLTDDPLAELVGEVARSLDADYGYNQQIGIGSPIRVRTRGPDASATDWPGYSRGKNRSGSNMDVVAELREPRTLGDGERYDTLLITERHDLLGVVEYEDTVAYLRHFHDRLIEGNPRGRTLFFHSWWELDRSAPEAWIAYEKKALTAWDCVTSKVNLTLEAEGRADRVTSLPAAGALVALVERVLAGEVRGLDEGSPRERLDGIFRDDVHLRPLGVYYMALVVYAAVYGQSPVGAATAEDVSEETAADLQRIAGDYVRENFGRPGAGARSMPSCRALVSEELCGPYWTLHGRPGNATRCRRVFADEAAPGNPFRWPDPQLRLFPAP